MKQALTVGQQAEQWASEYLHKQGLKLVSQNYHCRRGEIDLIMTDQDILVFVEVRYRKTNTFGSALESIDLKKQTKIIFTAEHYLQQKKPSFSHFRFDVVAITGHQTNLDIIWVKDAFQLS